PTGSWRYTQTWSKCLTQEAPKVVQRLNLIILRLRLAVVAVVPSGPPRCPPSRFRRAGTIMAGHCVEAVAGLSLRCIEKPGCGGNVYTLEPKGWITTYVYGGSGDDEGTAILSQTNLNG